MPIRSCFSGNTAMSCGIARFELPGLTIDHGAIPLLICLSVPRIFPLCPDTIRERAQVICVR